MLTVFDVTACAEGCVLFCGLEMLKAQVWVYRFGQLHFIITIKVWTRAPRKTNSNQQTLNYFVMILVTNSLLKSLILYMLVKTSIQARWKYFLGAVMTSTDIIFLLKYPFILLIILFILIIERISTSRIFTNAKCLIRTKFSCRHGLLLIVVGKGLLSKQSSLVAD